MEDVGRYFYCHFVYIFLLPFGLFLLPFCLHIFTAKWYILLTNGTFYRQMVHFIAILVHFVVICYILTRFGMLYREKSGNPVSDDDREEHHHRARHFLHFLRRQPRRHQVR
jgi:hypothetical protein